MPFASQSTALTSGSYTITSTDGEAIDVKAFHGEWIADKIDASNGKTGEVKDLRGKLKYTVSITPDEKISVAIEGLTFYEWTVEYNAKKKPVWIDLTPKSPPKEKRKIYGLIKAEGNNLWIHLGELGSGVRQRTSNYKTSWIQCCLRANELSDGANLK